MHGINNVQNSTCPVNKNNSCYFRLLQQSSWEMHSSELLRSE